MDFVKKVDNQYKTGLSNIKAALEDDMPNALKIRFINEITKSVLIGEAAAINEQAIFSASVPRLEPPLSEAPNLH